MGNKYFDGLRKLIHKNYIKKTLRFYPKVKCFEKEIAQKRLLRRYSPLTWNIKDCFYRGSPMIKWDSKASSKKLGSQFHQHVFHSTMCRDKKCICDKKGRQLLCKRPRRGTKLTNAIQQRNKFYRKHKLKPFVSEMIITSDSCNIGTQVDELALQNVSSERSKNKKKLWLISWKTGYSGTLDKVCRNRKYIAGKGLRSVSCTDLNKHMLQLLMEKKILEENGVYPDVCVIVYVLSDQEHNTYIQKFLHLYKVFDDETQKKCWRRFSLFCKENKRIRMYNLDTVNKLQSKSLNGNKTQANGNTRLHLKNQKNNTIKRSGNKYKYRNGRTARS